MGTFSKSLASLGGYMATTEEVADYVRHNSRPFIFSASMTPASAATALAALRHLEAHPELPLRLAALSAYARKGLTERGLKIRPSTTPIIPIYTYSLENTLRKAKAIYDAGVYVNPVLPPATPQNECLLRTSYMRETNSSPSWRRMTMPLRVSSASTRSPSVVRMPVSLSSSEAWSMTR